MNIYQKASVTLALCLYLPLAWQILTGRVKQNLATWLLWVALDGFAAASMFVQDGNWQLPAAYTVGGSTILLCMIKSRNTDWSVFETISCMMVVACIFGWYKSGPWMATILSTSGMAIATFAQLKDAYRKPEESPIAVYVGYGVVNIFSTIGGKSWSVEERAYPATCAVLCVAIVVVSCRKFLRVGATPRSAS